MPHKCIYVFFLFVEPDKDKYLPEHLMEDYYNNMEDTNNFDHQLVVTVKDLGSSTVSAELAKVVLNAVKNWFYR
jgi:hypothetical protein